MSSRQASNMQRIGSVVLAIILLAGALPGWLAFPNQAAAASDWTVTTLADDGGADTLRYAIDHSSDGDTISFADGLHGTINLDAGLGELFIEHGLVIEGPGANIIHIDGGGEIRVLAIETNDFSGIGSAGDLLQVDPSSPPDATVLISGLTLQNGMVFSDNEILDGVGGNVIILASNVLFHDCVIERGSAMGGGGIAVATSLLRLEQCTIRQNTAGGLDEDVVFSGGGGGMLTLLALVLAEDCVFEENVAEDTDDAVGVGGGITTLISECSFVGCDIRDNMAGNGTDTMGGLGGGVFALANLLLAMQECTISGNEAGNGGEGGIGGGVCVAQSFLTILARTLLTDNSAGSDDSIFAAGGGFCVGLGEFSLQMPDILPGDSDTEPAPGTLPSVPPILVNCTLSGNQVSATSFPVDPLPGNGISDPSFGGGASVLGQGALALIFCTVVDNSAGVGGGVSTMTFMPSSEEPEPSQPLLGLLLLKNSIVADNSASAPNLGNDMFGPVETLLGNIIGDSAGWTDVTAPQLDENCGDLIDVDPHLGPLADNGGPTLTHLPLPGSPAIDAACDGGAATGDINLNDILASMGYPTIEPGALPLVGDGILIQRDQRDEPRPVDGDGDGEARYDIGAVEVAPKIAVPDVAGNAANAGGMSIGECKQVRIRIVNEGDAILAIDHLEIGGQSAGDFTIVKDPSGQVLLPGHSTEVLLRFCPKTPGEKLAELIIYSNDPLQDPLELSLRGAGLPKKAQQQSPEPAMMSLTYLLVDPTQVLPGQQVVVSANVCNGGEERGSQVATLLVNGSADQSQNVAVSGGSCQAVVFTLSRAVPGTYQVSVGGMQGQFTVLAPRTVQSSVASKQYTGLGTGGLIAIALMVAVLVIALVYVFRGD